MSPRPFGEEDSAAPIDNVVDDPLDGGVRRGAVSPGSKSDWYAGRVTLVAVQVASFTLDPRDGRAVVLFTDPASQRLLPLWVDDVDAAALAAALRGERSTSSSTVALLWAAVQACGGSVERCELQREHNGVLRAVVVVEGAFGPAELPARASAAATLAVLSGAPLVVEEALLGAVHARLVEAAARQQAKDDAGVDAPLLQTTGERWNQLLAHLGQKLVDERPS
jgi:bifunctional DNase/RNase